MNFRICVNEFISCLQYLCLEYVRLTVIEIVLVPYFTRLKTRSSFNKKSSIAGIYHMIEQDLSIFVHPILTLSPLALFATTILAARSNISTTLNPVRAEHSAKLAAFISFCVSIISLYLNNAVKIHKYITNIYLCLQHPSSTSLTLANGR